MKPKKTATRQANDPPRGDVEALLALYNARRFAEAESRTRALLGLYPNFGFGWKLLGGILQMQGKDALPAFQKTAQLLPNDAHAHYNFGVTLKIAGRLNEAAASYRRAVEIKPDFAEAYGNLGSVLKEMGQLDRAVDIYRRALKIKPDSADTYINLGIALNGLGQLAGAAASYRKAVEIKPDSALAHYNLGNAEKDLGRFEEAVASYRRAVEIKPDFAGAHNNLGGLLMDMGRPGEAVGSLRRALELNPDNAETHSNLGNIYKYLGQLDDAMASYCRALEINPDYAEAQSNLLFLLNFTANPPERCLEEARKYGRIVSAKVASRFTAWKCDDKPVRLRVGMVSGDLHNHPVGYFLENLLANLDPARVELIAYSNDSVIDELSARMKPHFSAWNHLIGMSDAAAANLIHNDGVHVLLDLSGHTGKSRLPVFAWKPAPVQAEWLGYFATTGVAEMDYFLADEVGVPESRRQYFIESIWYLDTRLCFTAPQTEFPVADLPALKNGCITFGCFQNLSKVNDEVLALWSKVLAAIPGAKLRWQCKQLSDPAVAEKFTERLMQHGIGSSRTTLQGAVPRDAYLAAHAEVDMILDTFPYPGGTTTCEALWMGVPTLTLAGDSLLARQGASMLAAAGLEEWVADNEAEYLAKATSLSSDLTGLAALRAGLREQVRASPLFDAKHFAKNFEDALWGMWQACAQKVIQN